MVRYLKPHSERERTNCPFYGFDWAHGPMLDQGRGNQCALITDAYAPCQMEMEDQQPNWNLCQLNTEEKRQELEEIPKAQVFPKEFHPPGQSEWSGISLGDWMDYILEKRH